MPLYFASRLNFVDAAKLPCELLEQYDDPLSAAVCLSVSLRCGKPSSELTRHVEYILNSVEGLHTWPAVGYCLDPSIGGDQQHAASRFVTAAFCVEALALWLSSEIEYKSDEVGLYTTYAVECVKKELLGFGEKWNSTGAYYLHKLNPLEEICNTHVGFARACGLLGMSAEISEGSDFMLQLARASLFGWMAFTIYDDVIDGDADRSTILIANHLFFKFCVAYGREFSNNAGFTEFMSRTLRKMTKSNMDEFDRCKISNPEKIADKSMGHMLSSITVLFKANELGSPSALGAVASTVKFFRHLLCARQLNDDGHDWKQDFERGTVTAVVADLLTACHATAEHTPSIAEMETEFRMFGLGRLCSEILEQVNKARETALSESLYIDKDFFCNMVEPARLSAERANKEAESARIFTLAYRGHV